MSPSTNDDRVKFVDLIMRSMFYLGLEDTYLQQQICDHKDDDLTLKKFFDIACEAEQKHKVSRLLVCQAASWTVRQLC